MNALLTRPMLTAALTLIAGGLTYFGVIPAGAADLYVGEAVTGILAALTSRAAFVAWLASKAASIGGNTTAA